MVFREAALGGLPDALQSLRATLQSRILLGAHGLQRRCAKTAMRMPQLSVFVGLLLGLVALPLTAGAAGTTVPGPAIVKVAFNKKLNKSILVDGRGFTLYLFKQDSRGTSYCFDDPSFRCSKHWLPLRTKGAPRA